ncbi:hypothetical protein GCM10010172_87400 [Paractinoplanes ferrugineus]|uniref:Uncharacterized protein n=1 Tax=Paractinoplanes ferrugineus TaxID=113564 RepID=A0A919ML69_9ACTN|nr:hypothetical protein [Actinoplanes ferrugineus]GIE16515.1 hypothetical protein Afe05nite_83550 [Actinoplanes ferrugineus]
MAQVMTTAEQFGHREHVHLTWLAVRRYGVPEAIGLISDGIQRTARYAGAPQKYHATVSRAWVELVGHHAAGCPQQDFAGFADQHPALLDKRLLTRFYRSATLASAQAKQGWIPPDLAPFPWQVPIAEGPDAAENRLAPRLSTAQVIHVPQHDLPTV